jgi:hypothetical protein
MVETGIESEIVAVTKVWLKKHNWNMHLIKKGGQNSQIDINPRIFSPQVIEIS